MPLYADRHDGENLTPEAVVEGHAADLNPNPPKEGLGDSP